MSSRRMQMEELKKKDIITRMESFYTLKTGDDTKIDPGIRDVVIELHKLGYYTSSSCEGHPGRSPPQVTFNSHLGVHPPTGWTSKIYRERELIVWLPNEDDFDFTEDEKSQALKELRKWVSQLPPRRGSDRYCAIKTTRNDLVNPKLLKGGESVRIGDINPKFVERKGIFYHGSDTSPDVMFRDGIIPSVEDFAGMYRRGVFLSTEKDVAGVYGKFLYRVSLDDNDVIVRDKTEYYSWIHDKWIPPSKIDMVERRCWSKPHE